ncbi:membrane protein insertion efficiency factor YidD [uncultured Campylobacter sp.]|uniref:membrane protein insertion efficiency factor YidD n=1 Tax=uncultured Campylobacter sp. TaxID=218934 RepID=UPI002638A075|nr:membrane protein insertion efficiency factor YidD [uncultured Campylobacter sp.]
MFRSLCIALLDFYQKFLTILKPSCCRFYPSCSEYARWQFKKQNIIKAFFLSFFRIIRCNPYCKGGFDYPLVHKTDFKLSTYKNSMRIDFFYIHYKGNEFYMIKNIFKGQK